MAPEKSNNPYFDGSHQFAEQSDSSDHTPLSDDLNTEEQPPAYTNSNPELLTRTEKTPVSVPTQESSQSAQSNKNPIAIPAVDSTFDSPFMRAYAPVLKDYKLPPEVFFSFLDRLNKAVSSSPPLQVLDATGGVLNAVPILFPLHWIGSAVSGIAKLGNSGVSKRLKIEVAKLDALAHIAKIPILDSRGKVSRQAPLLQQLSAVESRPERFRDAAEGNIEMAMDAQQRRLRILQPWIADLELDILPWTSQSKLTRFNAALKKYNGTADKESKGKRRRERDSRQNFRSGNEGQEQEEEDDDPFRKCLWLVIREV
ncbi:hypothetical protein TCE0_041r14035 [Talaromyces pinophilus]|uniref:Uncharacterized protein n=1 Tax=Talaromyces pinophilus TaxID=128442 RepID=A0A6V8HH38_TALPI|nr:hypothetical protein TCE0_041r14035 [Talaromyces pinophilus]